MDRKFVVAWIVVFIAWMIGAFVVHGVLLHDDYVKLPNLFRTQSEAGGLFWLMMVAHAILAGAFTWIYLRGREARPWVAQGARYGVAVALLTVVPTYIIYYVVQPMPGGMAARQILFDGVLMVLPGVLVAWLYRNAAPAAS